MSDQIGNVFGDDEITAGGQDYIRREGIGDTAVNFHLPKSTLVVLAIIEFHILVIAVARDRGCA